MKNFRIAVKSFIVNENNKLLLIKRKDKDVHCPNVWEIPGGRLELGEDPFEGLKRETKEETDLDIEVLNPLTVKHFTREDGQKITMITFLCKPISSSVVLGKEHTKHMWASLNKAFSKIHPAFRKEIEIYRNPYKRK